MFPGGIRGAEQAVMPAVGQHAEEIARGERFEFGANWSRFLSVLDDERIAAAVSSVASMLGVQSLAGKTFLDVGCGSGLYSLAARKLGARVFSFDYDPRSVGCAKHLRERYFTDDPDWTITEGSALDNAFLHSLGKFDIVYSWGVLHHTGDMWHALANMVELVKPRGKLFISIYNDQGDRSKRWLALKKHYNHSLQPWRKVVVALTLVHFWWKAWLWDLFTGRPFFSWSRYKQDRGMSPIHDVVDWIGGYPFEVARPEAIFDFYQDRGFSLCKLKTRQSVGCNEYVFEKQVG